MNPIFLAFLTGLTTGGLSCLAVQGGLLASSIANEVEQSVRDRPAAKGRKKQAPAAQPRAAWPILLFLAAKLVAYTILGFFLGMLGSVLTLTPTLRAVLLIAIGIFMVGNALRMLNLHPIFRYFALEPPPAVTRYIRRKAKGQASAVTPLFLGALTVLIPCGVTQAMMAVAIASGSALAGATIMFAFILGTSPVFFAVAYAATRLGARLERSFMVFVAVVVLVLGLVSIDSGLTLAGWPYSVTNLRLAMSGTTSVAAASEAAVDSGASSTEVTAPQPDAATAPARGAQAPAGKQGTGAASGLNDIVGPPVASDGVVTINVTNYGYQPKLVRAKANQPVRLKLITNKTYSCSRAFVIPSLGVEKLLPPSGSAMLNLPAQKPGTKLFFSCSMGMYSGVIVFDA